MSNFLPRWCLTCPLACQVTLCEQNLFASASDTFFLCRHSMSSCLVLFTTACSSNHTLRHRNRCQQMLLVHNERNTKIILRQWAEVLRQACCTHFLYAAPSDVLISYLSVSCRVAVGIRVRFLTLNFFTVQKNEYSASYDPLSC